MSRPCSHSCAKPSASDEVVEDAVEDVDAVAVGGEHAGRQPRQHRRAAGHQPRARLLGEVVGADHEAGEAGLRIGGGGGERRDVEDGERRLDHRPQADARVAHACRAGAGRAFPFRSVVDTFGTRMASGAADTAASMSSASQGVSMPLTRMTTSRWPKPPRLDGVDHLAARQLLGVRRHRVLEVEDDAVDGERLGLFERAGIGARHVEHAAARSDGHGGNSGMAGSGGRRFDAGDAQPSGPAAAVPPWRRIST